MNYFKTSVGAQPPLLTRSAAKNDKNEILGQTELFDSDCAVGKLITKNVTLETKLK